MMRHARRATLLVSLCLLTSVATANAECAWVLWHESRDKSKGAMETTEWKIVRTEKAAAECDRGLRATFQEYVDAIQQAQKKNKGGTVEVTGSTFVVKGPGGVATLHWSRLVCLPDTVDPRGPKEGTRWVLWTHTTEPGLRGWWSGATWKPHAAYSSKSECEDPLGIRSKPGNDPLGIRNPQDANLKCLPDTVDPRGPKGK